MSDEIEFHGWLGKKKCGLPPVLGHFGHGHFGHGRFGLDISATDISATINAEGGRFGHNHKFGVWDVAFLNLLKSNMHVNTYSRFKDA